MKSPLRFLPFLALPLLTLAAHAAPSGRLAYLKNNAAYVQSLPRGAAQKLPGSEGASEVSLAPQGGRVLFFKGKTLFSSAPPYKTAQAQPKVKLQSAIVQWTIDGQTALVSDWEKAVLWRASNGAVQALPKFSEAKLSFDGKALAYTTQRELKLRDVNSGRERLLFSISRPEPLFDAIRQAKYPQNVKDLGESIDPDLWKEALNWSFGSLAFARDGQTLFWTCNAGSSSGAAGNTTYCWFATDLKTGKHSVLSKVGALFSRLPHIAQVSADGRKLLYVTSVHGSAVQNPCAATLLDLPSQSSATILMVDEKSRLDANLVEGAALSPDAQFVAISALFYSTEDVLKKPNWEPSAKDFTLQVRDARGRTVQNIAGATAPSWGK